MAWLCMEFPYSQSPKHETEKKVMRVTGTLLIKRILLFKRHCRETEVGENV